MTDRVWFSKNHFASWDDGDSFVAQMVNGHVIIDHDVPRLRIRVALFKNLCVPLAIRKWSKAARFSFLRHFKRYA